MVEGQRSDSFGGTELEQYSSREGAKCGRNGGTKGLPRSPLEPTRKSEELVKCLKPDQKPWEGPATKLTAHLRAGRSEESWEKVYNVSDVAGGNPV